MSKNDRVILVDTEGRLRTFNLPHEQYCSEWGQCSCKNMKLLLTATDSKGIKRVAPKRQRVCKSITIIPRGESEILNIAALECDEVKNALNTQPPTLAVRLVDGS